MSYLHHPITSTYTEQYGSKYYKVASTCMHNCRITMEDTHSVVLSLPNHPDISYFAVFDGHGGCESATLLQNFLVKEISLCKDPMNEDELKNAFLKVDKELYEGFKVADGSTACVILIQPIFDTKELESTKETTTSTTDSPTEESKDHSKVLSATEEHASTKVLSYNIVSVHLGDSRNIIFNKDDILFETKDHKPTDPEETERIIECGGSVYYNRTNGSLALSRAFGDFEHKNKKFEMIDSLIKMDSQRNVYRSYYSSDFKYNVISNEPTIKKIEVLPETKILLCCDGYTEKATSELLVHYINSNDKEYKDPADAIVGLTHYCRERGSRDNMSGILIYLSDGSNYETKNTYSPMILSKKIYTDPYIFWSCEDMIEAYVNELIYRDFLIMKENESLPVNTDERCKVLKECMVDIIQNKKDKWSLQYNYYKKETEELLKELCKTEESKKENEDITESYLRLSKDINKLDLR